MRQKHYVICLILSGAVYWIYSLIYLFCVDATCYKMPLPGAIIGVVVWGLGAFLMCRIDKPNTQALIHCIVPLSVLILEALYLIVLQNMGIQTPAEAMKAIAPSSYNPEVSFRNGYWQYLAEIQSPLLFVGALLYVLVPVAFFSPFTLALNNSILIFDISYHFADLFEMCVVSSMAIWLARSWRASPHTFSKPSTSKAAAEAQGSSDGSQSGILQPQSSAEAPQVSDLPDKAQ